MNRRRETAALPEGDEKVAAVDAMFDRIAPRYELLNHVLTFGMDWGWRRKTVAALSLKPASVVLDVGCGTGDLCRELEKGGYVPVGVDRSEGMLAVAKTRAALVRGDACRLPFASQSVDGIVSGFSLRNFLSLDPFAEECARVLRPGGRMALLEVSAPRQKFLQAGHSIYFGRVVPVIGGLVSDKAAYRYLPKSVAYLPEEPELLALFRNAGFADVSKRALSTGIAQLIVGTRS
ncbi:MAG: ubiquinone/menaquinone biosynthesis methyltransferase [Acidimicrobiia bacterium]